MSDTSKPLCYYFMLTFHIRGCIIEHYIRGYQTTLVCGGMLKTNWGHIRAMAPHPEVTIAFKCYCRSMHRVTTSGSSTSLNFPVISNCDYLLQFARFNTSSYTIFWVPLTPFSLPLPLPESFQMEWQDPSAMILWWRTIPWWCDVMVPYQAIPCHRIHPSLSVDQAVYGKVYSINYCF